MTMPPFLTSHPPSFMSREQLREARAAQRQAFPLNAPLPELRWLVLGRLMEWGGANDLFNPGELRLVEEPGQLDGFLVWEFQSNRPHSGHLSRPLEDVWKHNDRSWRHLGIQVREIDGREWEYMRISLRRVAGLVLIQVLPSGQGLRGYVMLRADGGELWLDPPPEYPQEAGPLSDGGYCLTDGALFMADTTIQWPPSLTNKLLLKEWGWDLAAAGPSAVQAVTEALCSRRADTTGINTLAARLRAPPLAMPAVNDRSPWGDLLPNKMQHRQECRKLFGRMWARFLYHLRDKGLVGTVIDSNGHSGRVSFLADPYTLLMWVTLHEEGEDCGLCLGWVSYAWGSGKEKFPEDQARRWVSDGRGVYQSEAAEAVDLTAQWAATVAWKVVGERLEDAVEQEKRKVLPLSYLIGGYPPPKGF
jgi:hypothetical protein